MGQGCLKRRLPICLSPSSPPRSSGEAWAWAWPCRPVSCANRAARWAAPTTLAVAQSSPHPACGTAGPATTIMTDDLKVLIVEDDPDIVLGCEQALQLEGIRHRKRRQRTRRRARGWGVIFGAWWSATFACRKWMAWLFSKKSCASTRAAGGADHGPWRHFHGRAGHEGWRARLHPEALHARAAGERGAPCAGQAPPGAGSAVTCAASWRSATPSSRW